MTGRSRLLYVVAIVFAIAVVVAGAAIAILYDTSFHNEEQRLREVAQGRARLLEAVSRFNETHCGTECPEGPVGATLDVARDAHGRFRGFGETGEFTLARRQGDDIIFLIAQRHGTPTGPKVTPFHSELAEPMRRALDGKSGTVVGLDYRGALVLAAYEPVGVGQLGIVAKVDVAEIRAPFVRAGGITAAIALVLGLLGSWLVLRIGNPLVVSLQRSTKRLESEVSEHRQARKALEESEASFRELLELSPLAMLVAADDGSVELVNAMFDTALGYRVEDVPTIAAFWRAVCPSADAREQIIASVDELIARSPDDPAQSLPIKTEVRAADGGTRFVDLFASRVGGRTVIVVSDITIRRRLEEQLFQSQRMESIGRLSGGVAHDFNNLLTVILTTVSLIDEETGGDHPLKDDIDEIREAAQRAAGLTRQLLAFSRRQVLQPAVVDLNQLVGDMDRMLRRLIGEDIDLRTSLAADLEPVTADPGQVEQVIMNLAVNARDAMPAGGKLTLETANVVLDDKYTEEHAEVTPGPYVMLAVSDTGVGMDAETCRHIFEPFFTTKDKARGTGLGLATVYGIVKQSGGHIWLYSEPGKGATFKIYLPVRVSAKQAAAADVAGASLPARAADARTTVLVIEDEKAVRDLAVRVLEGEGYQVIAAASGADALVVSAGLDGQIDLLLTDVVMPGMSGRQAAEALSEQRPELRVLYMSGYTDNAIVHHGVLDEGTHFLQKPFTREGLLAKVRDVLRS